jgi:hypothetical protein
VVAAPAGLLNWRGAGLLVRCRVSRPNDESV